MSLPTQDYCRFQGCPQRATIGRYCYNHSTREFRINAQAEQLRLKEEQEEFNAQQKGLEAERIRVIEKSASFTWPKLFQLLTNRKTIAFFIIATIIVTAILKIHNISQYPVLITALLDYNTPTQIDAANALGHKGDANAIGPLIACLRNPESYSCIDSTHLIAAVAGALFELGEPSVDPLIACAKSSNPRVREVAIKTLGRLRGSGAVELSRGEKPIIHCLKDVDPTVRDTAWQLIDNMDLVDTNAIEFLRSCCHDSNAHLYGHVYNPVAMAMFRFLRISDRPNLFGNKAVALVPKCKIIGDKPYFTRSSRVLIWGLTSKRVFNKMDIDAEERIQPDTYPIGDDVPVTVFVVDDVRDVYVGSYSISDQPAYKKWAHFCVVQFRNIADSGSPICCCSVLLGGQPPRTRVAQSVPERVNFEDGFANWVDSLTVN